MVERADGRLTVKGFVTDMAGWLLADLLPTNPVVRPEPAEIV
ncbi:MAG TPA: hypothetical protein VHZ97_14190 [Pseudonocardiaceae bacterium]|nr:hypothetical protein [Pseudonocardiaceae bacterium]